MIDAEGRMPLFADMFKHRDSCSGPDGIAKLC